MQYSKWVIPAAAAFLLSACSTMPVEELRSKLNGANVDVTVKSTIKEISFRTKTQQQSQNVGMAAGLFGAIPAMVVVVSMESAGQVDGIPVSDGWANSVAASIRGRLGHGRPSAATTYRMELNDAALLNADPSGSTYSLGYTVNLTVIDASDSKKLGMLTCSSIAPEHLTEQEWRTAHSVIAAARKEAVAKCSDEFIAKLGQPGEPAQTGKKARKR